MKNKIIFYFIFKMNELFRGLDLHNRKGKPFCHKVNCRVTINLIIAYGGLFCPKHYQQIYDIRTRLDYIKSIENKTDDQWRHEIYIRREEMLFRKRMEEGHMHYLLQLEQKYLTIDKNKI